MHKPKLYKEIKKFLKRRGNIGGMKMSNFGSIIIITFIASGFAYFLVGGEILTVTEPPPGSTVAIPVMNNSGGPAQSALQLGTFGAITVTPMPPADPQTPYKPGDVINPTTTLAPATGQQASVTVTPGCTSANTVSLAFTFTNPETYAVNVRASSSDTPDDGIVTINNIPPGQTRSGTVDTRKSAIASGEMLIRWAPTQPSANAREKSRLEPHRSQVCAIPTPTPTN